MSKPRHDLAAQVRELGADSLLPEHYANSFWAKVDKCTTHLPSPTYGVRVACGHEHLGCAGGFEWRCQLCGAYITDDPCGDVAGVSGWSHKRWRKFQGGIWSGSIRRGQP